MPKKDASLGRSLIRAHRKRSHFTVKDGYRHTSELPDGRDFGRIDLRSVTEQSSLDDFLAKAALAQDDYISEFSDIKIVEQDAANGILTDSEKALISKAQDKNKEFLCIPRRPHWDSNTSKETLDAMEKESFLIWRRKLALNLDEYEHLRMTPYEKNLEVWRQLWRVIERSDVVVQILDARNPLLFRCLDLEAYVNEVDERKTNVLLLNKADFLTEFQRKCWCDYFDEANIQIAFFSALEQMNRSAEEEEDEPPTITSEKNADCQKIKNSPQVLSRENLLLFLKSVPQFRTAEGITTAGFVGYPNVGKSSTLNALLMSKKVSVSATPGKTKHFQTFIISKDFCLCDCPGLVFPNFVSTKAEMITNGILPIDQLTNCIQPVSIITSLIPKHILQSTYSIIISMPGEDRSPDSKPTAEEFLNAHGYNRGFMTERGLPDISRSSRYILKDFVNGKLLYCHAPPGMEQEDYHQFPDVKPKKPASDNKSDDSQVKTSLSAADKRFFGRPGGVHYKGKFLNEHQGNINSNKPWKMHCNKNKKQKLRKIYKTPYE